MSSKGTILFISSNTTGTGRLFLEKAKRMGYEVVLICDRPDRFGFVKETGARIVQADLSNEDSAVVAAIHEAKRMPIVGVLSSSDYYQIAVARVAKSLGLPGPDPDAMRICRDKAMQRERLRNAGVAQPRSFEVCDPKQACKLAYAIGGPVIIKPVDGTGSVGVQLVQDPKLATKAVSRLLSRGFNERGLAITPRVLIEEFLAGPEFSIELFHGRVIGVTQKFVGAIPHFVEIGHTFPAPLEDPARRALEQVALDAVRALGLNFGGVHVEAKLIDKNDGAIIEVNPRLAGGYIPTLVELTGTDLIGATIAAATGSTPPSQTFKAGGAAIRFLTPPREGVLLQAKGLETARRIPGVVDVAVDVSPGREITQYGDFRDRIGRVIAEGRTPLEAAEIADMALARIRLIVEDHNRGEPDGQN